MAVLKMQKISICALKKDRKAILEQLQHLGVLEVDRDKEEDAFFQKMDTTGQRMKFEKAATAADQALGILDAYAPEKKSLLSSLEGKELIDRELEEKVQISGPELIKTAREIYDLDREHAELRAGIAKIENQIESLMPWMALDVPLQEGKTKRTALILGTMPGELTLENIYSILLEKTPEVMEKTGVDVHLVSAESNMICIAVICLKEQLQTVEEVLRSAGFARPSQNWSKTPKEQKEVLETEIAASRERMTQCEAELKSLASKRKEFARPSQNWSKTPKEQKEVLETEIAASRERMTQCEAELKSLASKRKELQAVADYYRVRADKYAVLGDLLQSKRTFVISGYIPACESDPVEKSLTEKYNCMVDIEDIEEGEEAPVILKNNPFSTNMEGIVESYGLPHAGEIDPTTIMSFFYVFFFGMMLSDAAYGAVVAIVCAILVKKYPRMSQSMAKSLKLFFYCGVSTLVWGVLFGGYFGNIVDIVSEKFFGHTVTVPALWFVPLNDPMKLLVYSLLFGTIHLFVGLGIKGYLCLKDGKVVDFICDVVLWFVMLIGLILMLLPSDIFASIAQTTIVFPAALNTAAKVMAAGGAIGIVLMSGRANKNPALRLALGAYDLYNVTGWLSDALSYSRLLALGLATGVIASVINQMGAMLPNNVIGVILFIVIFIVGHVLNLAINLLGAYVHTNRLQFVEFFGKFYEGGGKAFEPFKENTKYVDVKEETTL